MSEVSYFVDGLEAGSDSDLCRLVPGFDVWLEKLGGGEELRLTSSRIFSVEGRLGKIRLLMLSGGGQAPGPEP